MAFAHAPRRGASGAPPHPSLPDRLQGNLPILLEDSESCQPLLRAPITAEHLPGIVELKAGLNDEGTTKMLRVISSEHRLGAPHRGHASNCLNICGAPSAVNLDLPPPHGSHQSGPTM